MHPATAESKKNDKVDMGTEWPLRVAHPFLLLQRGKIAAARNDTAPSAKTALKAITAQSFIY